MQQQILQAQQICSIQQKQQYLQQEHKHKQQQQQQLKQKQQQFTKNCNGSSTTMSSGTMKRSMGKKQNWGNRKRAGMSFLIVIAFFAIFGLIILMEVFMIDERSHGGVVMLRHGGNYGSRLGDSLPDYDNVKDDYDLLDESLLSDSKLGFVQFRDNRLKIQDADNGAAGRLAGILLSSANGGRSVLNSVSVGGSGSASNRLIADGMGVNGLNAAAGLGGALSLVPWGKMLSSKDEKTLPPYPFGTRPTDGSWQVVNGTRFKFFVFSAYYDRRDGARLVRIIGATKTRGPERVWCRFWYKNRNATSMTSERNRYISATVMARVKVIRENWNLKYSACFILCPARLPDMQMPQFVSVVARLRAPPGNLLQLRNTDDDPELAGRFRNVTTMAAAVRNGATTSRRATALLQQAQIPDKIAVCVKPFHFNYDQALYLMEYIEFYTLLGVSHFTFYNHTIGPHVGCVLDHYVNGDIPSNLTAQDDEFSSIGADADGNAQSATAGTEGGTTARQTHAQHQQQHRFVKPTVQILPWNLRMRSQKEIRTEGLFAALNDCLYRNMYRYKYLALVDLDELIVPRQADTLNELLNSLNRRLRSGNAGAYSFQNGFFYLQFPDDMLAYQPTASNDVEQTRVRASLVTQRKTKRRFKLHPQKQRSKYICKPEAVIEAGNHFVWEFAPGKGSLNVAPSDAILQHYRVCEFGGNDCVKAPAVNDRTATKYVNRLVQRVHSVYNYLKDTCKLPDLPPLPKKTETEYNQAQNIQFEKQHQQIIDANSAAVVAALTAKQTTIMSTKRLKVNNTKEQLAGVVVATPPAAPKTTTIKKKSISKHSEKNINSTANKLSTIAHSAINAAAATVIRSLLTGTGSVRKKRKFVVFEEDDDGRTVARLEYA